MAMGEQAASAGPSLGVSFRPSRGRLRPSPSGRHPSACNALQRGSAASLPHPRLLPRRHSGHPVHDGRGSNACGEGPVEPPPTQ
jgi:hypothetical protein